MNGPNYHDMIIAALVFIVLPLVLVGGQSLIMRARARGKRLFVDLPAKRLGPPRPAPKVDHRWDAM